MPNVASLRAELEQVNRSINDLNHEINRLTDRLAPEIASYQSKKEKYDRDNATILAISQSLEVREKKLSTLDTETGIIRDNLNIYINNHNNKIDLYRSKRSAYEQKVDILNEKIAYYNNIRNDPDEDSEKLRRLKADISRRKLEVTQLETELNEIANQLDAEVQVIDEKNEDLRKRKQLIDTEMASIDTELIRIKNWSLAQDQIENELKRESTQISVDQNVISSKRAQLVQLNIKKQLLIEQISQAETDIQYLIVAKGQFTFDAEGTEGGPYHSRKPHVPTDTSGLTIGRGYDLGEREKSDVLRDLKSVGLSNAQAQVYADAVKKKGASAREYINTNKDKLVEISLQQQKALFELTYAFLESDVIRICNKEDTVEAYGRVDWSNVNEHIRIITVDLRFRGDYHPASRRVIQKHIASNNFPAFSAALLDARNWPGVPEDRFKRRKEYLQNAMLLLMTHEEISSAPFITITDLSMFKAIKESSSTGTHAMPEREYLYAKL